MKQSPSDALTGPQRPLALAPMLGAAAGWIDERRASLSARPPRTPRAQKAPLKAWAKAREGAGGHRFLLSRDTVARAEALFPGIPGPVRSASPAWTKRCGPFATATNPRFACFFPRVALFLPRVCFQPAALFSLSSLSFLRGGGRKKGGRRGRGKHPRVEDVTRGYKTYGSGKKRAFPGISGDRYEPKSQCFQWVSGGDGRSPGISGDFPLFPRGVVV